MSANNYIMVRQTKKGFEVCMVDAESGSPLGEIVKCKTLEEAVHEAIKQNTFGVEYGRV